jgi:MOSC domain-containing protein YiiM
MAHVVEILITPKGGEPLKPVERVVATPGHGLEGDRYHTGAGTFSPKPQKPKYELTLIQQEHVKEFAKTSGLPFTTRDSRRNIVTQGIDLNTLVGQEFQIGPVKVRGLELCEPCNYLAKKTFREVLPGLLHKGGLRAQILTAGEIKVGDALTTQS